mgnify:CR=1 FL=1
MQALLTRAGCFVAIIILGFVLRRTGFFNEHAFGVLSKVVLKITFPASIIFSFASMDVSASMLTIAVISFACGLMYMGVGYLSHLRKPKNEQAFAVLNLPGYNIGIFTVPFVQSFLGPVGMVATSIFDIGNAFICLGGAYGVASAMKAGKAFDVKRIGKALLSSLPFMCYIVMILVNLLNITVPSPVLQFAEILKNANAFLAMLMIGVGFQIKADKEKIGKLVKFVVLRYLIAIPVALIFYFALPFALEIRQTLVVLAFSPVGSAVPAFTGELKEDVGLSSAINSVCIVVSIVIMVTLLSVMLV